MPWVGAYIAAASAVCTLAMAADAFNGFRRRKLWFPCAYFSLNPTSLTLLGVAMKLTMDLTAVMKNIKIAKLTTLIFLSTAMANFASSLGSIDGRHLLSNVVALAILVATVLADVMIRLIMLTLVNFYIAPLFLMLLSLATLASLAAAAPAMKRSLEAAYRERHRLAVEEEVLLGRKEGLGVDERRRCMMKYWVMASTSNPQFVVARSVVCTMSALLCVFALVLLPVAYVFVWRRHEGPSVYRGSVEWILYTQTVGVAVATIAPVSRWFVVVSLRYSAVRMDRVGDEILKIENYWIQTLVDLRESFSGLQIGQGKFLHDAKWFAITFCIGIQILIVSLSKLFVLLSALAMTPVFCLWKNLCSSMVNSESDKGLNLSRYVLLLEGEADLPSAVVRNICSEADIIIQAGKMRQPKSLRIFLSKSINFKGLGLFDSSQIPSLHSREPVNCWSLPVVTLTSIALAIPHASGRKREELLTSVKEGLSLAMLVEKTLQRNDRLRNVKEATNMSWLRVSLYMKWLDFDLKNMSIERENSKEVLKDLSDKAETIVADYLKGSFVEDPLDWPAKVIAANAMYRISRSVALSVEDDDEGAFETLCVMIADVMAACLTNLPNVITAMCRGSAIEKREESVGKAFMLLGETEEIVEGLRLQEWPPMDHERAAEIEEWRAWFRQSGNVTENLGSISSKNEQDLSIRVDI